VSCVEAGEGVTVRRTVTGDAVTVNRDATAVTVTGC
jgi:hypothetical protein